MPKEQGHFVERSARSTSKNAKDKNNSVTVRASQGGTHRGLSGMGDMSNHILCCDSEKDSEKDSGYSEAGSDSVHTDADDQRSSVNEPSRESSNSINNNNNNIVNATGYNMLPYEELPPIYIIKNLVVKPSRPNQLLHGQVVWSGGWHNLSSAKAPTQLLLIQQSTLPASSTSNLTISSGLAALQGPTKKGGNQNHISKKSYLPILNSYPRIAPHPKKECQEDQTAPWVEGVKDGGSEGHSQSKRVCIEEEKKEALSISNHLPKPQQQKDGSVYSYSQYKGKGGQGSSSSSSHLSLPSHTSSAIQIKTHHCQQSLNSHILSSPSISSSKTPSPPYFTDSPSSSSPHSSSPSSSTAPSPCCLALDSSTTHQRRFLNTAEILNQSGLLAITLRAKELLKQNAATEREITQLRQHTNLLCQIAETNQNVCNAAPGSLTNLLQAMTESGSYPNLDLSQVKSISSSHQHSDARCGEEKEEKKDNQARTAKTQTDTLQVVLQNTHDGTSPPSPLFAPSPDMEDPEHADSLLDSMCISLSFDFPRSLPEQGNRQAVLDKDLSNLPYAAREYNAQ